MFILGEHLKKLRKSRNLTQKQLAEGIGRCIEQKRKSMITPTKEILAYDI